MKVIFSSQFQVDLHKEEINYREISERLASAFRERSAELRFGLILSL